MMYARVLDSEEMERKKESRKREREEEEETRDEPITLVTNDCNV